MQVAEIVRQMKDYGNIAALLLAKTLISLDASQAGRHRTASMTEGSPKDGSCSS
ncbi:hypothetical protein JCGZ_13074 [Jatropha curcas]|uniref:Uncharacterized protein n=1 Tax=Jatropha curcas TaxID=180498 RepID=A0A067KAZ5_JATCU|nr:hypothetical protein JCGZ_13074 [Jatropha curcas]